MSTTPTTEHDPRAHCPAHSPLAADLTSSHNSAQGPSHHRPQDVTPRRPTKRQRQSPSPHMTAERASSSSDASSQSGMADNDTEAEPVPLAAPPKKKRTRTLTTPHQSAVLHALLAKSRFPSTVAREEAGRQIGLSARKVQIWFQNQRQKARRPQSESAPLTRPPQFGPFPIVSHAGPSSTSPTGHLSEVSHSASSSVRSAHESESIPPLSGPGMPGWSSSSHPPSLEESRRVPTSPQTPLGNSHPRLSEDISAHDSRSPRFSRVLPPIHFTTEPHVSATSPFSALHPPSPVPSTIIPPPFVLQPQPQWDPHTFVPFTRPEFASWSQPSGSPLSSARSSFSPHDPARSPPRRLVLSSPGAGRDHVVSPPPRRHRPTTSAPGPSSRGDAHTTDDRTGDA